MAGPRSWWRNATLVADSDILEIDRLEDAIAPLPENVSGIRALISSIELCHHKAQRWIDNIIEDIGVGKTTRGLGTRLPGRLHPAEQVWQNACASLSAWCAGHPASSVDLFVGAVPACHLLGGLGNRCALKEWQAQRVAERIRSLIGWPPASGGPAGQYVYILLAGGEGETLYRSGCPEHYREHEDFWLATVRTMIRDTDNGKEAALSLGVAVDMLWPCHWRFVENLRIVLQAIGGKLEPGEPFAACARNIGLLPIRGRMEIVSSSLRAFCGASGTSGQVDHLILSRLGPPSAVKRWLAASLEKTIRMQLDPPVEVRSLSSLSGPDWITPSTAR